MWCSVDLNDGNQDQAEPMSLENRLAVFKKLVDVGLKVGFEDVDAWKNAIAYIRNNPNLIKEMGTKGRILAETKYNIIQCALQLHQYIQILN